MKRTALEPGAKLTVNHWRGVKWEAPVEVLFQRELQGGWLWVKVNEGGDKGVTRG